MPGSEASASYIVGIGSRVMCSNYSTLVSQSQPWVNRYTILCMDIVRGVVYISLNSFLVPLVSLIVLKSWFCKLWIEHVTPDPTPTRQSVPSLRSRCLGTWHPLTRGNHFCKNGTWVHFCKNTGHGTPPPLMWSVSEIANVQNRQVDLWLWLPKQLLHMGPIVFIYPATCDCQTRNRLNARNKGDLLKGPLPCAAVTWTTTPPSHLASPAP